MSYSPPTSSESDPVDAVFDLLDQQPTEAWSTTDDPTVLYNWDRAFSEKGPGDDQPPELYVWSPIDGTIDQLTADGAYTNESHTVEVQVWALQQAVVATLMRDLIHIFGEYMDNQQTATEFITLPPSSVRDLRSDAVRRQTSHYLATVEVEPRKLEPTGVA